MKILLYFAVGLLSLSFVSCNKNDNQSEITESQNEIAESQNKIADPQNKIADQGRNENTKKKQSEELPEEKKYTVECNCHHESDEDERLIPYGKVKGLSNKGFDEARNNAKGLCKKRVEKDHEIRGEKMSIFDDTHIKECIEI